MPKLLIDGDAATLDALRLVLGQHATLTARYLTEQEEVHFPLLPSGEAYLPPADLPHWCVLPATPHVTKPPASPQRNEHLILSTDGSSQGNPGPCGMAVVVSDRHNPERITVAHGWGHPGPHTNNKVELTAVLSALNYALSRYPRTAEIRTDSQYVCNNLPKFETRARTGNLDITKNADLWRALIRAKQAVEEAGIDLTVSWVKGHAGDLNNERADKIAVKSRKELKYIRQEFSQNPNVSVD